jgi:RimJ/RimL family protein N-acetyltransferase
MDRPRDVIHTERLTLRRWTPADAPRLSTAILESLDHLRPWMPWVAAEPVKIEDRAALIQQWQREWDEGGELVVGIFKDDVVVGGSGLHTRRGPGVLEIGYWVHPAHARCGIATEAAEALTTVAFAVDGIERVEIHHDKANVASAGVPRRLGFTFEGETQDSITSPGEVGIDCRWTMTRQDWAGRAQASPR